MEHTQIAHYQWAVSVLKNHMTEHRLQRMQEVVRRRTHQYTVVFQNLNHTHNVAAMMRTSEAFGLQEVHLISNERRGLISNDISRGTHHWMNVHRYFDDEPCMAQLKENGYKIVCASPSSDLSIEELPFNEKLAFVMGNEVKGVNQLLMDNADLSFKIPMRGFVESFNVSVALGIILNTTFHYRNPQICQQFDLSEFEQLELLYLWIKKTIKASESILKLASSENSD